MHNTPALVRVEAGIRWTAIWRQIGVTHHSRKSMRKLVRELSKRALMQAALSGDDWLTSAALLEAMRRVNGSLQTDLEDFAPVRASPPAASAR